MDFKTAVSKCFNNYVTFSGRAQRSEFWYFILFTFVVSLVLGILDERLSGLWELAVFLPTVSVAVRRLHDLEKSGWWWWLCLIPLIGWIILIVWYATEGTRGANDYGPDPIVRTGSIPEVQ